MGESKRLAIIVPAYNEEESLPETIGELLAIYGDREDVEILVIDDGSSDRTAEVAEQSGRVTVIRHPRNRGNGAAIKTGLAHADADIAAVIDADGQHDPNHLESFVSKVGEYDMVVGARAATSKSHWVRDLGNWILRTAASYLVRSPIPDLTCGFRAFRLDLMRPFIGLLPDGFGLDAAATVAFLAQGHRVLFQEFVARPRRAGESKIRPLRDGARYLGITWRLILLFHPLRVFLPLAAAFGVSGVVWGALVLMVRHQGLSVGALFLVTVGLFIGLIGIVADQLSEVRRQLSALLEETTRRRR